MAEVDDIRREMSNKPAWSEDTSRTKVNRPRRQERTRTQITRKQPRASERASLVAQDWYDRGETLGFSFPYDVNFLALALQRKVEADPRMKKLLDKDLPDNVERWLTKMVANWWDHYVDESITASNAKDYFLGHDWEDLRDWALSNLQKDRAVASGKVAPKPEYPNQQEFQQRLEDLRRKQVVDNFIRTYDEGSDMPAKHDIDPADRERLRSFGDRRRKLRRQK